MRDRFSAGPDVKGIRIREKRFSFTPFDVVYDSSQKNRWDVRSIPLFTEVKLEGYQILFVDFFLKIDTVQKQVNPVEDCLPRMDSKVGKEDRTRHLTSSNLDKIQTPNFKTQRSKWKLKTLKSMTLNIEIIH
jgi:hypothetical protein